jgi:hypothetical protein
VDKSNAGQRTLGARSVLRGAEDSLENILAMTVPDGAQCFVLEEQANFRLIKNCELAPDEHVVVKPVGPDSGRWVRESGLVGYALLSGGTQLGEGFVFGKYTSCQLVQFSMNGETTLVYTGTVRRLALVGGISSETDAQAEVNGEPADGFRFLSPGDQILLVGGPSAGAVGSLQVVLV